MFQTFWLRKKKVLKQSELSSGGISNTHLSNIEKGRYTPQEDILDFLSHRLGVQPFYLINFNHYDKKLEEELEIVHKLVIIDPLKAQNKLLEIESNPHFPYQNIELELMYLILKTSLNIQIEESIGEAGGFFEEINTY